MSSSSTQVASPRYLHIFLKYIHSLSLSPARDTRLSDGQLRPHKSAADSSGIPSDLCRTHPAARTTLLLLSYLGRGRSDHNTHYCTAARTMSVSFALWFLLTVPPLGTNTAAPRVVPNISLDRKALRVISRPEYNPRPPLRQESLKEAKCFGGRSSRSFELL